MVDGQAGKGDKYRPVNFKKWDEGWEAAFGKPKKKGKKNGKEEDVRRGTERSDG